MIRKLLITVLFSALMLPSFLFAGVKNVKVYVCNKTPGSIKIKKVQTALKKANGKYKKKRKLSGKNKILNENEWHVWTGKAKGVSAAKKDRKGMIFKKRRNDTYGEYVEQKRHIIIYGKALDGEFFNKNEKVIEYSDKDVAINEGKEIYLKLVGKNASNVSLKVVKNVDDCVAGTGKKAARKAKRKEKKKARKAKRAKRRDKRKERRKNRREKIKNFFKKK